VTATGWLRTGEPEFEATARFRDRLLAIKRAASPSSEVLAEAESLAPASSRRRATGRGSQPHPDVARADALLRRIGEEVARRSVLAEEGPGAAQPPAPPEVVWHPG
jgi:hypothetical protein